MSEAPSGMTVCKAAPGVYAITPPNPATKKKRVALLWDRLAAELYERGIELRWNLMTRKVEAHALAGGLVDLRHTLGKLESELRIEYTEVNIKRLYLMAETAAVENKYNPVIDYLSGLEWDGVSRLPALYKLMGVADSALSMALVHKWLYQCVAMLFNGDGELYGAEGALVLNGAQGCGKTSLFARLALRREWFREGASIDNSDKDTKRRCLTAWLVELGEVESTFRSDIEALKAFITQDRDEYRLPYEREDVEEPRRSSLCATCNSDAYLIDTTGNRRWFTVPITRVMPYEEIQAFEAEQLWAEIFGAVSKMTPQERGSCFRLSAEERAALAERNGAHVKPIKAETEVRDIIEAGKAQGHTTHEMTVTAWKDLYPVLSRYSSEQVSKALRQIGVEMQRKRLNGEKNASKVYELPLPYKDPDNPFTKEP